MLCDARTGARVATLATCAGVSGCGATILAGGTIAAGEAGASGVQLRLFSATGALQRTISVGPGRALAIGGQPTPATLVITTQIQAQDLSLDDGTTVLVDIDTGTVAPLGRGYVPRLRGGGRRLSPCPRPGASRPGRSSTPTGASRSSTRRPAPSERSSPRAGPAAFGEGAVASARRTALGRFEGAEALRDGVGEFEHGDPGARVWAPRSTRPRGPQVIHPREP